MTKLRGPIAVTAAAALFLLGACARPAGSGGGTLPDITAAPDVDGDTLMVRIRQEGGFTSPEVIVSRIPMLSVYADGRVITEGPTVAIYPGPALPNLQVRTITPDEVSALVEGAVTAGVRTGADLGSPGVADAPSTRIDVVTDAGLQTITVEALNEAGPGDSFLTPAQQKDRTKLKDFVNKAVEPAQNVTGSPYEAATWAALAQQFSAPDDGLPKQPEVAWPGPDLPGSSLNPDLKIGCVEVTGAGVAPMVAAAQKASQNTPWASGGNTFRVTFRPMLPDEDGCAALKEQR